MKFVDRTMKSKIIGAVLLGAGIFVAAFVFQSMVVVRSAEDCIRTLQALTPGRSQLADVEPLVRQSTFAWRSDNCSARKCSIGFGFESWLSRLRIAKPTRFQGEVVVGEDKVQSIHFVFMETDAIGIFVTEGGSDALANAFDVSVRVRESRTAERITRTALALDAPLVDRRRVLDLNLNCLGRLRGCNDVREILPSYSRKAED